MMCMIVVKSIGHDVRFNHLSAIIKLVLFVDYLKFDLYKLQANIFGSLNCT